MLRLVFSDLFLDAGLPRLRFFLFWVTWLIFSLDLGFVIGFIHYEVGCRDFQLI